MKQRRYISYLFCLFVVASILAFTPSALADTGTVTGNVVNLRSGPGTNYQVVSQLGQGTDVSILNSQNGWYEVQLTNGSRGWMSSQFIKNLSTTINSSTEDAADSIHTLRKTLLAKSSIINQLERTTVQPSPSPGKPNTPSRGGVDRPVPGETNPDPSSTTIVIDPGHGGTDPGAIYFGAKEKDLNLAMGLKLGQALEQAGYQVIYTHSDDNYVSLTNRSLIANNANPALFVSIHCNASTNKALRGTTTYYTVSDNANLNNERLKLATAVQSAMVANLGIGDKGVRTERFLVTRETTMPSILVETGFMSNSQDYSILSNDEKQWVIASSIAQGIVSYLNQE